MTTIVNPTSSDSGSSAMAVFLAVVLMAVVGFVIYGFSSGSLNTPKVIEHNTTIEAPEMPAPSAPAPAAPPAPSAP